MYTHTQTFQKIAPPLQSCIITSLRESIMIPWSHSERLQVFVEVTRSFELLTSLVEPLIAHCTE